MIVCFHGNRADVCGSFPHFLSTYVITAKDYSAQAGEMSGGEGSPPHGDFRRDHSALAVIFTDITTVGHIVTQPFTKRRNRNWGYKTHTQHPREEGGPFLGILTPISAGCGLINVEKIVIVYSESATSHDFKKTCVIR